MPSPSRMPSSLAAAILCFITPAFTQSWGYPPAVSGLKELRNPGNPDVYITYKEPSNEICRTWNPDQKQYAGHVHLPPGTLAPVHQDYPINTFFWFFEARQNPENAPLTIWLNGGPGSSSMVGLMNEVGPCMPVPANKESITTIPRKWGWDGLSNMLFIDQPNQVGFSYDTPTNGSLPLLDINGRYVVGKTAPPEDEQPRVDDVDVEEISVKGYIDATNSVRQINGTFGSGNSNFTANTTQIAARAAWHFLQTWLDNFPQYNPKTGGVNLFAESYGGKYGPTFFEFFELQNERRRSGELSKDTTLEIRLESLGIVNGCIDAIHMTPSYMHYANDNPYGIVAIDNTTRDRGLAMFQERYGCAEMVMFCRIILEKLDSMDMGENEFGNEFCSMANHKCDGIRSLYRKAGRGFYDIAHWARDPFPGEYYREYLNNATVLEAIGARTNFSEHNGAVYRGFSDTGDFVHGGQMEAISYLLQHGVRVGLIYGDRDFICNYMGGEAVSLAIEYPEKAEFRAAGYQDIEVNDTYIGGQVRQYGNFSFSRIYQAGHLVPAYQPETAYRVFERLIKGTTISKGEVGIEDYSSTGSRFTTTKLTPPKPPKPTCFVRAIDTCDQEPWLLFANKEAIIFNGVVYNSTDDYPKLDPLPAYPPVSSEDGQPEEEPTRIMPRSGGDVNLPSVGALLMVIVFCAWMT